MVNFIDDDIVKLFGVKFAQMEIEHLIRCKNKVGFIGEFLTLTRKQGLRTADSKNGLEGFQSFLENGVLVHDKKQTFRIEIFRVKRR